MNGPLAQAPGFDHPSAWCRSGSAFAQDSRDGSAPPSQPGSVGDLTGGATLCGAIAAALFRRERTGQGAVVDHALYMMGTYIMTQGLAGASLAGSKSSDPMPPRPTGPGHPTIRAYRTRDDRFIQITFLIDAWFPDLARKLGRPDLADDPRFKDEASKMANAHALVTELEKEFAKKTLFEWCEVLEDASGVWAPQFRPAEVLEDEQALINGFVTPVTMDDGETYLAGCTPGQFDERPIGTLKAAPTWGQHTDQVLGEWGVGPNRISALKQANIAK